MGQIIIITFTDGVVSTYDTEDWDDYNLVDDYFCVRKSGVNVGIFNMQYIKSIIIK